MPDNPAGHSEYKPAISAGFSVSVYTIHNRLIGEMRAPYFAVMPGPPKPEPGIHGAVRGPKVDQGSPLRDGPG